MIQLQVLSGKQAGGDIVVRRFPFVIGRGAGGMSLEDKGVWEEHLRIDFEPARGFVFSAQPSALTLVNSEPCQAGVLRNGDWIELGSARLRFWLARSTQKSLRIREIVTWIGLLGLCAAQIALIWWLLR